MDIQFCHEIFFKFIFFIDTSEHSQLQEDEKIRNRNKVFGEKAKGKTEDNAVKVRKRDAVILA